MQHRTNLYILKLFFFSFCLIATLVSITQVSAEGGANNTVSTSSSATASVTVSSACSFERIDTGAGEYTGTLTNNGSVEVPGSTFKTICNDPGGYAIYAIGYSNDTLGNTDLIFNNTSESTNNIKTDGTNGNSYWKMKAEGISSPGTPPSIVNGFNNYRTIPNTYTKIAQLNTTTDTTNTASENITGSSISVSYQAYASSIQPAGTYTGAVKYTMVHPNVTTGNPYIIIFDSNGGTGDMNAQAILPNTPTLLSVNKFTPPANQAFGGWCTTSTTNCADGTLYTNEQEVTNLTTAGGEITLYAMWGKTIGTMTYLQDFASPVDRNSIISTMTEDISYAKTDSRDNKSYYIAKLKDGHIWMTQNLDLDIISDTNAQNYIALTSENTDLSTDESVYTDSNTIYALKGENDTYGYTYENGVATWIPERDTIAYNQLNGTTWANDNNHPYSYDRLDISTGALVYPDDNVSQATAGDHGLSGNYYNWTASLASNDSTNASGNPTNSICPKGWRLPNITNKEFGNLLVQYGIISTNTSTSYIENQSSVNSMGATPLYLIRSGYISNGLRNGSGSRSYYWSSTRLNTSYSYNLYFASSIVYAQNSDGRLYGFSVRCVAR